MFNSEEREAVITDESLERFWWLVARLGIVGNRGEHDLMALAHGVSEAMGAAQWPESVRGLLNPWELTEQAGGSCIFYERGMEYLCAVVQTIEEHRPDLAFWLTAEARHEGRNGVMQNEQKET